MTSTTATQPINSVSSSWLRHMTDQEIRDGVKSNRESILARVFPGKRVHAASVSDALAESGADFTVAKRPIFHDVRVDAETGEVLAREITTHVATYREDTGDSLGVVGTDYGVVQYHQAFEALDVLARRGDLEIVNVQTVDAGAKVRVTALLGETTILQATGEPNTLGHYAMFEASHDGNSSVTATLFTLRLECFNGMTSRQVVESHKLRHTSKASDRMEELTGRLLTNLIEDAEAELATFRELIARPMDRDAFTTFATDFLGGELKDDASKSKKTRRENELKELLGYFDGGNEGAGETAWGAYNSVTRWLEAKRERLDDAQKAAKRFESNVAGDGSKKAAKALRLLA